MPPHTHLESLIQLQKIDTQILTLTKEKDSHPALIKIFSDSLEKSKKQLEAMEKKFQAENKIKKQLEIDLQSQTDKISKLKSRVSELKTNKEYQTNLHEVEVVEKMASSIEDKILESMERVDKFQQEVDTFSKNCKDKEEQLKLKTAEMEKSIRKINSTQKKLNSTYIKAQENIDADLLAKYNKTKSRNHGLGLVGIKKGACLGCYISLPPQFVAEVKKGDHIRNCPHCKRLLFWSTEKIKQTTQG